MDVGDSGDDDSGEMQVALPLPPLPPSDANTDDEEDPDANASEVV